MTSRLRASGITPDQASTKSKISVASVGSHFDVMAGKSREHRIAEQVFVRIFVKHRLILIGERIQATVTIARLSILLIHASDRSLDPNPCTWSRRYGVAVERYAIEGGVRNIPWEIV